MRSTALRVYSTLFDLNERSECEKPPIVAFKKTTAQQILKQSSRREPSSPHRKQKVATLKNMMRARELDWMNTKT